MRAPVNTIRSMVGIDYLEDHVDHNNKNSYISFQHYKNHLCGGARLTVNQVLVVEDCFVVINKVHFDILAVVVASPNTDYYIEHYKSVKNTQFCIIMVSSITQN